MSSTINIINTDGSTYTAQVIESPKMNMTVLIASIVSVLSVGLLGLSTYLVMKKLRFRDRIQPEDVNDREL